VRSENIAFSGPCGTIQFDVQPPPAFVGKLGVTAYEPGTNIAMPPAAVGGVATNVIPRAALPSTGLAAPSPTAAVGAWLRVLFVASFIMGAGAMAVGLRAQFANAPSSSRAGRP
jgi:hypothetical protein